MKIAVVPIDNRPICYDLIKDILAIDKSIELFIPKLSALGGLIDNSNIDEIFDFIEKLKCSRAEVVAIITKSELAKEDSLLKVTLEEHFDTVLQISAEKDPAGAIEIIENSVCTLFTDEKIEIGSDAIISSARENAALKRTLELLDSSISAAKAGLPQDIYSSDLEFAAGALAEIDGRAVSEEVVADIFSKFCVGK